MFRLFGFSALIHACIGWRLLPDMPFAALAATGAWLAISTVLIPASLVGRRASASRLPIASRGRLLAIGAFSSLLVLTVLRDVALLFAWAAGGWLSLRPRWRNSVARVPSRCPCSPPLRRWWDSPTRAGGRRCAPSTSHRRPAGRIHGFTIAQISDIHIGSTIRRDYLAAIVDAVNDLEPDMIAVTGDLVDGSVAQLAGHTEPMARLTARHGAYFVTGNHEYYSVPRRGWPSCADWGCAFC